MFTSSAATGAAELAGMGNAKKVVIGHLGDASLIVLYLGADTHRYIYLILWLGPLARNRNYCNIDFNRNYCDIEINLILHRHCNSLQRENFVTSMPLRYDVFKRRLPVSQILATSDRDLSVNCS